MSPPVGFAVFLKLGWDHHSAEGKGPEERADAGRLSWRILGWGWKALWVGSVAGGFFTEVRCPLLMASVLSGNASVAEREDEEKGRGKL